jgi:hypothetical protein
VSRVEPSWWGSSGRELFHVADDTLGVDVLVGATASESCTQEASPLQVTMLTIGLMRCSHGSVGEG